MARRPFRSRVNDPRLPTLDDDLETLIKKANAIFSERRQAAQPQPSVQQKTMSRGELLQRVPENRQQMPERTPARRGLMRRESE